MTNEKKPGFGERGRRPSMGTLWEMIYVCGRWRGARTAHLQTNI